MIAHSNLIQAHRQGFPDDFRTLEQGVAYVKKRAQKVEELIGKSLPQKENSATILRSQEFNMKMGLMGFVLCFSLLSMAAPAVLVEEVEPSSVDKKASAHEITPLSQRTSLREVYQSQEFDNLFELRNTRRVGVGASVLGATGLLGGLLELNLTPSDSFVGGFGGGQGYGAFNFQWKHILGGRQFSPYLGVGYAQWYNASGDEKKIGKTVPNELSSKFLTDEEKQSGKFQVSLLNPQVGLQYTVFSGPWTGVTFFGEINFLMRFSNPSPTPIAGFGSIYYF
jgi:hypothetical protein